MENTAFYIVTLIEAGLGITPSEDDYVQYTVPADDFADAEAQAREEYPGCQILSIAIQPESVGEDELELDEDPDDDTPEDEDD